MGVISIPALYKNTIHLGIMISLFVEKHPADSNEGQEVQCMTFTHTTDESNLMDYSVFCFFLQKSMHRERVEISKFRQNLEKSVEKKVSNLFFKTPISLTRVLIRWDFRTIFFEFSLQRSVQD